MTCAFHKLPVLEQQLMWDELTVRQRLSIINASVASSQYIPLECRMIIAKHTWDEICQKNSGLRDALCRVNWTDIISGGVQ